MVSTRFSRTTVAKEISDRLDRMASGDPLEEQWEKDLNRGAVVGLESLLREVSATKGSFSRKSLQRILQAQVDRVQRLWGFDPTNGYAQVQDRRGETHMWEGYGNYRACLDLAEELEIPLHRQGSDMIPLTRRGVLRYVPRKPVK